MEKYKVFINDNQYEFDEPLTIKEACATINTSIPTIYLSDDIDYVDANDSLVDSFSPIEDGMVIYTNNLKVTTFIENKIREVHAKLKTSCNTCSVVNCPLKEWFNKYSLDDNGYSYKGCMYYQNGVRNNVLLEEEAHPDLEKLLCNKNIHKVAIIDAKMSPKKAEILNKGFNEVITNDFVKKFKIIEESALFLKEIAKSLDKRENLLPVYLLEDISLKHLVSKEHHKNIISIGSLVDVTTKIFKYALDYSKVNFVYITNDSFNNETHQEVTYEYLMSLPNVDSSNINNVERLLKLDNKEINYNSFVNYLLDILKSKQQFTGDIYSLDDYEIKLKGRTIKISNLRYSDCNNSDVILVLSDHACSNTPSVLYDKDVNYVYKNYLKKTGEL